MLLGLCQNHTFCKGVAEVGRQGIYPHCRPCVDLWADGHLVKLPGRARCPICLDENVKLVEHGARCKHGLCGKCWAVVARREAGAPVCPSAPAVSEKKLERWGRYLRAASEGFQHAVSEYIEVHAPGTTAAEVKVYHKLYNYELFREAQYAAALGEEDVLAALLAIPGGDLVEEFLEERERLHRRAHEEEHALHDYLYAQWDEKREGLDQTRLKCPICRAERVPGEAEEEAEDDPEVVAIAEVVAVAE